MHKRPLFSGVLFALLLFSLATLTTAQTTAAPEISFTVAMPKPHTHLFDVAIDIKRAANGPDQERLIMPVWTPGSYLIREFERHVQDFNATDAAGQPLKWEKINKDTWRVMRSEERRVGKECRSRWSPY